MPTTSLSIAPLLVLLAPVAAFAADMPPAAAPPPRPNILIAIADDWSYPHAGAYGCTWVKTPAFDRVAREGALFTRAYTPNAKCAPSRSCLLTGRNSWQLQEVANHWCFWYGATEPHRAYEYGSDRGFYERFMRGETKKLPGWVEPTDFGKQPVK